VVPEAPLESTKFGLRPGGEGWFVMNARDSRWRDTPTLGAFCNFEGKRRFPGLGINLNVLPPGEPMGLYHRENAQEDFLVLAGECLLIVEGEERKLKTWDFFHCPPGTEHIIVGAGSKLALKHNAGVERETTDPSEAYGSFADWKRSLYQEGWLPDL
jgi:uncharacterized cupin superfamily protein